VKLDLHTHPWEATLSPLNKRVVGEIVACVKRRGIQGIGITEHHNKEYGYRVAELVREYFPGEILVIPGQEIDIDDRVQVVELYLKESTFRFLAHPGHPGDFEDYLEKHAQELQGIEVRNLFHDWKMDQEKIRRAAKDYNLLLLSNSDAHSLWNIGRYWTELKSLSDLHTKRKIAPIV
jgi:hypothetical protein